MNMCIFYHCIPRSQQWRWWAKLQKWTGRKCDKSDFDCGMTVPGNLVGFPHTSLEGLQTVVQKHPRSEKANLGFWWQRSEENGQIGPCRQEDDSKKITMFYSRGMQTKKTEATRLNKTSQLELPVPAEQLWDEVKQNWQLLHGAITSTLASLYKEWFQHFKSMPQRIQAITI